MRMSEINKVNENTHRAPIHEVTGHTLHGQPADPYLLHVVESPKAQLGLGPALGPKPAHAHYLHKASSGGVIRLSLSHTCYYDGQRNCCQKYRRRNIKNKVGTYWRA
jgi:hypothetical protein